MLKYIQNLYIRIFLLFTIHVFAINSANYWAHRSSYILLHKISFVWKCNR